MLEGSSEPHARKLVYGFKVTDPSVLASVEPPRRFFTHLAHNKVDITVGNLKEVIEKKFPNSRIATIFPTIEGDIKNEKVNFTLKSTLAELVENVGSWIYFLTNVAEKVPENSNQLLSWKDIAHHYGYDYNTIEGFCKDVEEEKPVVKLFRHLSCMDKIPTIGTLKRHLRHLKRNDIIKVINQWASSHN